jgi:hypothetical protein
LIAALAPRPTLLYTPREDRDATFEDVAECISTAKRLSCASCLKSLLTRAWPDQSKLVHIAPDDYTGMTMKESDALIQWATATFSTFSSQ